jgi:integrase
MISWLHRTGEALAHRCRSSRRSVGRSLVSAIARGGLDIPLPASTGPKLLVYEAPRPDRITKAFKKQARALGLPAFRLHDLRGTHETLLLDRGVPVHVVAARCGHDPAVLLRIYAKRTRKTDMSASAAEADLARGILKG